MPCRHGKYCNGPSCRGCYPMFPNPGVNNPQIFPYNKVTFTYSDEEPDTVTHAPEAWNNSTRSSTREQLVWHAKRRGLDVEEAALLAERWFVALAPVYCAIIRNLTPEEKAGSEQKFNPSKPSSQSREADVNAAPPPPPPAPTPTATQYTRPTFSDNRDWETAYQTLLSEGWDPKEAEESIIENYLYSNRDPKERKTC